MRYYSASAATPHHAWMDGLVLISTICFGLLLGYFVVGPWEAAFPYLLVVAASSFIYVAVADLLPQLQRPLPWSQTVAQLAWLAAGLPLSEEPPDVRE